VSTTGVVGVGEFAEVNDGTWEAHMFLSTESIGGQARMTCKELEMSMWVAEMVVVARK